NPPTWQECIRTYMAVLLATDFFTTEVWTLGGLVTYYVLFFIHLGSRHLHVAGVTPHPNAAWMVQVARNVTMEEWGLLSPGQYLIHDRDTKFCAAFQHNWLRVLDTAELAQIDHRIPQQLHPIVALLDAFKAEQQPLELIFPRKGPLDPYA